MMGSLPEFVLKIYILYAHENNDDTVVFRNDSIAQVLVTVHKNARAFLELCVCTKNIY